MQLMIKTKDQIEREIKSQLEEGLSKEKTSYEKDITYCLFFNNFNMDLPCPPSRRISLVESFGEEYLDDRRKGRSGRTLRQYYQDIDEAIENCKIDKERMGILARKGMDDLTERRKLFELIFPVFIELLAKGYTYTDLYG